MSDTTIIINIKIPAEHAKLVHVLKRSAGFLKALLEKLDKGEAV